MWTEMLAARQILSENFSTSPWLRRYSPEQRTVFQLMVRAGDPFDRILNRLGERGVDAVDLNLACNSMCVRACEAGSALFENLAALRTVLSEVRSRWPGLLTAKIRLGSRCRDWQPRLAERMRLLEEAGVDAVILHPRFFEDKFKRRARHELIPWVASLTRLPLIANGDLTGPEPVQRQAGHFRSACAVMIGRSAIVRPWVFATWNEPVHLDIAEIWRKMCQYIVEDFPPAVAFRRVQMFTKYFAANFAFGHQFNVEVSNAPSLESGALRTDFFRARPRPSLIPRSQDCKSNRLRTASFCRSFRTVMSRGDRREDIFLDWRGTGALGLERSLLGLPIQE